MAGNVGTASSRLSPGFRFHPTDEELVRYYLRRKVCGKPFGFDAISEIDIYKSEPWDLPAMSRLKTRDLEWYFFSVLDKKYGNGSRTNRATERGYWKTTGKDRAVYHRSRVAGMKKTLVYHSGRAPRGERSNWVMHEYRLVDEELQKSGVVQDAFVLCRVFQKSGSGPKNGEQYGAPFIEEEWEDDDVEIFPKEEAADEVAVSDDAYLDENDIEQILGTGIPEGVPIPSNYYHGESGIYVEESTNLVDDSQKPWLIIDEIHYGPEQLDDQRFFNMPVQNAVHVNHVKNEYIGEPSNTKDHVDANYLLDEAFFYATDNPQFDGDAFLEAHDLSNPIEADASGLDLLEEYLSFFDADGHTADFASGSTEMMGSENILPGQVSLPQENVDGVNDQVTTSNQLPLGHENDLASSSKEETPKNTPAFQYPFVKQANRMLGNIPSPPAFASEFPTKNISLPMTSGSRSSNSVHVTTGMIQIGNINLSANRMDLSFGKHGDVNIVLSFGLSRGSESLTNLDSMFSMQSCKVGPAMARSWFYFIFFWVLVLSMSFKFGTYIRAR